MNKAFISYLSNKLKTGNLKTIHLNALPGRYATRLDLTKLDLLSKKHDQKQLFDNKNNSISHDFLFNYLFKKEEFQFKINFENVSLTDAEETERKKYDLLAKRLDALYNQNQDNYLEHGIKTFSFGYPLLVKRSKKDANKIIKAPVFLWSLDIERSNAFKNHWTIVKGKESPIYLNEVLTSYINSDESITIDNIPTEFLEDNILNDLEIKEILELFLNKFNSDPNDLTIRIEECPDVKEIERISPNKPWILWTGIFGLFKTQKQSIINDSDKLLAEFEDFDFEDVVIEPFRTSLNTSVLTDPSQDEIIDTLEKKEYKIIQGPPGTGKSQSLTAVITNAIENGGKVLVVCEKKTALDIIYNNLKDIGLEKLIAIVDDVISDRKRIIDTVRQIIDVVKYQYRGFHEEEYDSKLGTFKELIQKANQKHHNLLKKVFKGYDLQHLISQCLKYQKKINSKERLFDDIEFSFNESEYDIVVNTLKTGSELYEEVTAPGFVYKSLSEEYFTQPYSTKTEIYVHARIEEILTYINQIDFEKVRFIDCQEFNMLISDKKIINFNKSTFANRLKKIELHISYWDLLLEQLKKIEILIQSANPLKNHYQLKKESDNISQLCLTLTNNINCGRAIQKNLVEVLHLFSSLNIDSENLEHNFFFGVMKFFSKKQSDIFLFWKTINVNQKNVNHLLSQSDLCLKDELLYELLKDDRYDSLIKPQKDILEQCVKNKAGFKEYYEWRHFYELQPSIIKNCLTKLSTKFDAGEWENVFRLNYLNLVIEKIESELGELHSNNKLIENISALQSELKGQQKHKILKYWEDKQFNSIYHYNKKSNIKWLFNYQKNSQYSKRNSLRTIIHDEFDLFTTIFPVVLVNPIVSSSILPLKQGIFDVVIFDEASQLRLEDTYPALIRGRVKIISGDKHQMPPSNYFSSDISLDIIEESDDLIEENHFEKTNPLFLAESESLLDFGNNLNPEITNTSYLDFHYRSRHPYLIDFSNAAFYGSRLVPMPAKVNYNPIQFLQINGLYESNYTNPSEARSIVEYVKNEIHPYQNGEYPSLGIATFNMQQRNLIKDLINEESIKDHFFREKMQLIGKKEDWFVKNLENIQGDEKDLILISTTFGNNSEGKFGQYFGPINTYKGYKLLNVIITRAKKQLVVFTSIPEDYYTTNYQDEIISSGNKGKALLYCYLDYCKAVSDDDDERRKGILELLKIGCKEEAHSSFNQFIESPFEQEVYDYLLDYIDKDKIVPQYPLGGFKIDFVLLNKHLQPIIAIECDGAAYHSSDQAYSYDIHRQRILENQGFKFIRIWSKSWWPDPNKEIYKILKFIEDHDSSILKKS